MPRPLPNRRRPRPAVPPRRMALHRMHGAEIRPLRTSDFVLALLGIVLLGGIALAAAFNLAVGMPAP